MTYLTKFCLYRDPEMISITSAPEAPPPRIRILDSRLREVETVRIGDKLTFRIEIPEDSMHIVSVLILLNHTYLINFQLLTASSLEVVWQWRRIRRAPSKLWMTKVVPSIPAFSLLSPPMETLYNLSMKLSDSLNLTVLFSSAMSNTVWDHANR